MTYEVGRGLRGNVVSELLKAIELVSDRAQALTELTTLVLTPGPHCLVLVIVNGKETNQIPSLWSLRFPAPPPLEMQKPLPTEV